MNNNKRPTVLVLGLLFVTDMLTRKVLATNAQKNLFKQGYEWCKGGQELQDLEAKLLIVSHGKLHVSNDSAATIALQCLENTGELPRLFAVEHDYADFLKAAKEQVGSPGEQPSEDFETSKSLKDLIAGVKVDITKDRIDVDASVLLAQISSFAKQEQEKRFGRD